MKFNQTVKIKTTVKSVMSDLLTPVGIYLRLRDKFRDTILLESAGNQNTENSFSFIAINAVAGIEIRNYTEAEIKFPLGNPQKMKLDNEKLSELLNNFSQCFICEEPSKEIGKSAQGFFGYTSYDAIPFFENIKFTFIIIKILYLYQ
jgi:anthranilate synthase component 1